MAASVVAFPVPAYSAPAAQKQATAVVTGEIVDNTGEPLIGATVMLKAGSVGASTDIDGKFSINVPVGSTLVVSYVGYRSKEVKATSDPMKIVLEEDSELLDEVVVVGYGTQKKATMTGAVTAVIVAHNSKTKVPFQVLSRLCRGRCRV